MVLLFVDGENKFFKINNLRLVFGLFYLNFIFS